MHTTLRTFALACTLAAASIAQARPDSAPPMPCDPPMQAWGMPGAGGRGMGKMTPEARQARHEQRLAVLKAQLKLQPQQEAAWKEFTQTMQPPQARQRPPFDPVEMATLTTPQRIEKMQALHEQFQAERTAQWQRHTQAVQKFYAALDADQQKVFDASAMPGPGSFGRGHKRGPGR
ncbi:Spy/CpxP family protein refolding chaperone [Candidatus Symbiobacter mobilis]|uniref:LTXXQ motif family protein n=1 Tax=Candidatus Symbiobacter mobilis CR TaxID=946483 RepID=U5NET0_9BURK|nr:Spy/CpxP family protein refolding chaperone [Candidatus Symbiobacter mobilis]AGX88674.1 hypothetical protein Cenrod_2624 [Candidatus Symbiobacter mobilis CR]